MRILITGGAGFIGSALIRQALSNNLFKICTIDNLTYAGNLDSLIDYKNEKNFTFIKGDICDANLVNEIYEKFQPQSVMHLAAESHVDRSIHNPKSFMDSNIIGTYTLLEESRKFYKNLSTERQKTFRFHHISTDEVYGDLGKLTPPANESTKYNPSSPYSASKAASDHLVRAWSRTYKLPIIITNCSNNYGPFQFPEKLIPKMILNAIHGKPLKIYGDGSQIRDWLYVEDHAKALIKVIMNGKTNETYNIGGRNEKSNLEVVESICELLEELSPPILPGIKYYKDLITFITDRPGHDSRYSIDSSKIEKELNWTPDETFESGLYKTVQWYLKNKQWWEKDYV